MEDSRLMHSMLLDFYGELLTDKQRVCCELHYNEDLSLAEIAEQLGISRQGVWDNIRRADAALTEFEDKTKLAARFTAAQRSLDRLCGKAHRLSEQCSGDAQSAALEIERELERLKQDI